MAREIIGFCRFSFFGRSDTKISFDDKDVAFEALYNPARMEARFALFERLFLPSIAAQTDPDFRLIVLSSMVMPEPYRERLTALCNKVPQIELVLSDQEKLAAEMNRYTRDPKLAGKGLLQFRIDDDDALSQNFIARLRKWDPVLQDRMVLTLPRGLMLYDDQTEVRCNPMYRNLTGAGFAFATDGPAQKNVFGFAHIAAGRRFAYVSDPGLHSFIQTFTASSDTAFRAQRKIRKFLEASGVRWDGDHSKETLLALEQDFPSFELAMLEEIHKDAQRAMSISSETGGASLRA